MPKSLSSKSTRSACSDWYRSVCRPAVSQRLTNPHSYVTVGPVSTISPIDQYLTATESLLKIGNPSFFSDHPALAGQMLVALVSETESYFRDLFSRLLLVCPVSQNRAALRDVKLGSVIWYRTGQLERGAFEHFSFASSDNIIDTLRKYFDIQIDEKSDPYALLQQFDLLCELRHAAVHSGGLISGKNALKLQLVRTELSVALSVDFQRFQEVTELCTSLVCSMNIELFKKFGERWRDKWPACVPNWSVRSANIRFKHLWSIFASSIDQSKGLPARALGCVQCRKELSAP